MAFVPAAGVACESIIIAIVIEVDSVVTIGVGSIACKSVAARFIKVDTMRVFRGGIIRQCVIVAIIVEVNSGVVIGSGVGRQFVFAGLV